jgi:hypothetical protein
MASELDNEANVSVDEFIPGGKVTLLGTPAQRDLFIEGQQIHGSSLGETAPGGDTRRGRSIAIDMREQPDPPFS